MRPSIIAVATATPSFEVAQDQTKDFARNFFAGSLRALDRMLGAFDNTRIQRRQLVRPLSWYAEPHSFVDKNAVYCESALQLAEEAARKALRRAKLAPADVDAVVVVTTTGIRTPSLDGALIDRLGLPRTVARLPIWGLGCAGGAAGLARAAELVQARGKPVLLVAVEVCSATFVHGDRTKANLIATALFGDGAAAAVLAPAEAGLQVAGSASRLLEDTEDVMGWTVVQEGLRVRFARSIPAIVREVVPGFVQEVAASGGLRAQDLSQFILHPGGAKVLEAYGDALHVEPEALDDAYAVLAEHGNMSSPTVLFVMERFLAHMPAENRDGIVLGLGPGFSAEGVLVRWCPPP